MKKVEWKKYYGGIRRDARLIAAPEFIKNPQILSVVVPFFMPVEATSIDRTALIPIGNCEFREALIDENGDIIHAKMADRMFQLIKVKRQT